MPSPALQSRKGTGRKKDILDDMLREPVDEFGLDQVDVQAPQIQAKRQELTEIPSMPSGQILKFNILKTWGDMNYLGLTGIEVFDHLGNQVDCSRITAFPPDINVLPDYGNDPRTVDKLVDGNYFTNDDLNVWLTPFTSGEDHTITINFGKPIQISMIRVWNYNKSRIHAYRGARQITAELDSTTIFKGEIKKAPGNVKNPEDCCEIILFTEAPHVLTLIDMNDWLNEHEIAAAEFDDTQRIQREQDELDQERPMTATKKFSSTEIEDLQFQLEQQKSKPTSLFDERPQTSAVSFQSKRIGSTTQEQPVLQESKPVAPQQQIDFNKPIQGRKIWLNITESWGDLFYVGLNGLEVLNSQGEPIPITVTPEPYVSSLTSVKATPRDMNSIPGHGQDHRTLEKLFNTKNNTMDDRNMWLIPFNKGEEHTILIDLGETRTISALKFYNYNKSPEDSLGGAKQVVVKIDDQLMTPKKGITIRKAPGFILPGLDIGQPVGMPFRAGWTNEQIVPVQKSITQKNRDGQVFQEYDAIGLPVGFIVRFNFYSTHGDLYYIGLNGIQLYDQNGLPLLGHGAKICAHPADIRHLPGMQNDVRCVDKLVNGHNDNSDDSNMWLAPFKNTKSNSSEKDGKRDPNFVCLLFDRPTAISAVQIWNYTKTPARGVHEFEIEIDGSQLFRGYARQGQPSTVLFDTCGKHIDQLAELVNFNPTKRQNVMLMNERKVMGDPGKVQKREKFVFDEQARPQTKAINNFM